MATAAVQDVETAVARAADHAERRADNIIKAIAGVEKRIEALAEETPHKSEVVMTADLEALLTEHAHELDNHLDKLKADLMSVLEVSTTTAPHTPRCCAAVGMQGLACCPRTVFKHAVQSL